MRPLLGEMPFLDHLEELRVRIIRSLGALVVGFGIGLWLVQRFRFVALIKAPIAPYLPGGKLTVLSPTDPVMIVLKLAFVVGLVFASPVVIWQLWAFLSPALYQRERKALVPALFVGLLLFMGGALFAWVFVIPTALKVLLSFQSESFATLITYNEYFSFVIQIVLAMGISSELPLLMIILTALGITTPAVFSRFRRFAIVLSFIAGSFLSPGADIFSMLMMTAPLLLLYEVGVGGSLIVHRRRLRREAASAAGAMLLLCLLAAPAEAQQPVRPPGQARPDTTRPAGKIDSASAKRLGLPSAPSRPFGPPDSVMAALLDLEGYDATRYLADTATVFALDRRVRLSGHAMTERQGSILEAEAIGYQEASCDLTASGEPRLFDKGTVLIGNTIRYDTCAERGIIGSALTNFSETGANWFLRGNLGVDSSSSRLYAAKSEITSCDLPVPHYHFAAKEVKWMSKSMLVGRPAILYVRDVPIMWIPFIFQETKPGRQSGILVPQFGFNDIVRPDAGYNRQVTNAGYYWAPNDYVDVAGRFDWYANRYFRVAVSSQYAWLNRFVRGSMEYSRQTETGGAIAQSIRWGHQQTFGISTTLNLNLNLTSNSSVISNNALDPLLSTQQLSSDLNFSKRFKWGQMTLGGRRRQTMGDDQVSQTLPSLTVTPKPIDIGSSITWSPAMSFANDVNTNPKTYILVPRVTGGVDSIEQTPRTRASSFNLDTPLRIGSFNWRNVVTVVDREETTQGSTLTRVPNDATPDPTDSITVSRVVASRFSTEVNWDTGINLPLLFRSSWKLTPTVGITNTTGGAFALRNEKTNGGYVIQGKRLAFGLSASPTIFGFFPGFGPVSRIRHSFSPSFTWSYAPAASIPRDYAEAVAQPGRPVQLTSDATQQLSVGLSQNFEAKEKAAPGDTAGSGAQGRKFRILSINTTGMTYDFEQAKKEGHTGWTTQSMTNSFQSDMVPGFNLSLTHDLWDGQVGITGTKFSPFLQNVTASFGMSANTFRAIGGLLGLNAPPKAGAARATGGVPSSYASDPMGRTQGRSLQASNTLGPTRRPFTANVNLTISRARQVPGSAFPPRPGQSNIGFSTSFSPTRFWGVSWSTQYDITNAQFAAQVLRFERDLHDWRAGFNFVRNPNGNFAFYFTIHLMSLPDLKLDYNQTTLKR